MSKNKNLKKDLEVWEDTLTNSYKKNSYILTNRIHTFNKELRLIERLGKINQNIWQKVLSSLWLGINEE